MVLVKHLIVVYSLIIINMSELAALSMTCPDMLHWKTRARLKCPKDILHYHCLRNGTMTDRITEECTPRRIFRKGRRPVYNGNLDAEECSIERFSPVSIWTNEWDKCPYLKSKCREEGQVIGGQEQSDSDRSCRCDYTKGYDYVTPPRNPCKCEPRKEDCSCYLKQCGSNEYSLSSDYNCSHINIRLGNLLCPKIDTSRNQEKNSTVWRMLSENSESEKDRLFLVNIPASIAVVITTVFIMSMIIVVCCIRILNKEKMILEAKRLALNKPRRHLHTEPATADVKTKDDMLMKTEIFHQLNDMILVPKFQEVHQLAKIKEIDNDEKIRIIILRGQTGAGKTQSAYWFCNQVQRNYSIIANISAVNESKFIESLQTLAKNLHLDLVPEEDDMRIIESVSTTIINYLTNVREERSSNCLYLLLIDDVHVDNTVNDLGRSNLSKMVSKTISLLLKINNIKFIITTTNPMLIDDYDIGASEVVFEGMTSTECMSFLKVSKHFENETPKAMSNLIKLIGCLPITINTARKFMIKRNMHINKYIKKFRKVKNSENGDISNVVNCQKIPLEFIKKSVDDAMWKVISFLPYLDHKSIYPELLEACCHHVCNDEAKAEQIICEFRDYSLCQYLKRPRQRIFTINDNQEDIMLSFHSETMLTLRLINNDGNTKESPDREKLISLIKIFCFEIDLDARIDTTLGRNLMFLDHARRTLHLFEDEDFELTENEKVYVSYVNFLIGKTILYQGTDIPLAHKHLMKSRALCLDIVGIVSDLTGRICSDIATKKGNNTAEVPPMESKEVKHGYESLRSKTLNAEFVNEFVFSKRRNKRDVYVLQQESGAQKMCKSNYLSEPEYRKLYECTPKLAMPLELLCKSFLSELMLHILHDNGRALNELMLVSEHNKQVKRACYFEVKTYKEFNRLIKNEEEFKDFPLLRYLAIERWEHDINVRQRSLDDIKSHMNNLKELLQNKSVHYFQFGVAKTLSSKLEHHNCNCYRLLIKCLLEKYKLSAESEKKEILEEGRKYVEILREMLLKIDKDENAVKWVEMPKFYNQCANFLQLSGEENDIKDAVEMYGKAIVIEENRQAYITRFLQEGYHGKVTCLLTLNMDTEAKCIYEKLKETLPNSNDFLNKMHTLFR